MIHWDVFEGSFSDVFSSVVCRTRSSDVALSLLISIVNSSALQVQTRLRLTKRLARMRSGRLIDGHLVRLPPLLYCLAPSMTAVLCGAPFLITSSFCSVIEHPAFSRAH
jgi:hypothetical protein